MPISKTPSIHEGVDPPPPSGAAGNIVRRPYARPDELAGRYAKAAMPAVTALGGPVTAVDGTYRQYKFERPTILRPIQNITPLDTVGTPISAAVFQNTIINYPTAPGPGDTVPLGPIFACPNQPPPNYGPVFCSNGGAGTGLALTTQYDDRQAIRSTKFGLLMIPTPGVWYIRYAAPLQFTVGNPSVLRTGFPPVLLMQELDASDPVVMSWYMSQQGYVMAQICSGLPGANDATISDITLAGLGSVYRIPANLLRTGIIIQMVSAGTSGVIRFQLGQPAVPIQNAGLLLNAAGQSISLTGDTNFRGPIAAYNAVATPTSFTYTELVE